MSADEAEIYVDRLAAVAASTASDLQELSTGMSKVASAAASLGVGEDQLAAQLSTIISVTRQAPETVGTSLKTVYARITDIQAGVEEDGTTLGMYSGKLAEMGINVLDTAGNLRDMGTVIEEVGNKWAKFSREQQIYIAQTMAGQRQYSNLISLFDNFDKYNEAMQVADKSAGTLSKQQDIYMDSINAHMNQLTSSTEKMWKSMIDSESMKKLLDFLSGLTNSVSWLIDSLGGGGNVLLTLGNIATTVFQKQMTASIATTLYNFDQMKQAALDYKTTIAALDLQIAKLGNSDADNAQRKNLERKKQIVQANRYGFLPQEQLAEIEQSSDKLRVYQATINAITTAQKNGKEQLEKYFGTFVEGEKIVEEFLNTANGAKSTDFAKVVYDSVSSYEYLFQSLKRINAEETTENSGTPLMGNFLEAEISKLEEQRKALQSLLNSTKDSSQQEIINAQITSIKNLQRAYESLKNSNKQLTGLSQEDIQKVTQYRQLIAGLQTAMSKTKMLSLLPPDAKTQIDNFIESYNKLQTNIIAENFQGVNSSLKKFQANLTSLQSIFPGAKDGIDSFKEAIKALIEASNQEDAALKAYEQQLENFQQKFSQLTFATAATEIAQMAVGLNQAITLMNQIKNLGSIWGKENISGGEKFLKTLTAVSMSLTTLIPNLVKNIRQINLYNAVKARQAQRTREVSNADKIEAGSKVILKTATDSAKKSVISFMAVAAPYITIISMIASAVLGVVQAIGQFNEQQKKARTEQNKAAIENIDKTLEEINQQKELYKGLKDLAQQYEQGALSKNNLKEKTIELCKQYNLESDRIKGLIGDYGKLNDAILQAEKAANQEDIKNATSKRNTALQNLLLSQEYQKKGSQYVIEIQTKDASKSEIDFYQNMGWAVNNGKVVLSADYYDKEAVSKVIQTAFKTYQEAAGEGFTNSNLYYWLKEFVNYAKQYLGEDIIEAQQQIESDKLYGIVLDTFGKGAKTQQQYTQAYKKAMEQAKQIFPNLTQEQLSKNIEKILLDKSSDAYIQYQNVTDLARQFENIEGLTYEILSEFSEITSEDLIGIDLDEYNTLKKVQQLFKSILKYKKLISETSFNNQELIELQNNYQIALEKIQSGKNITKKEFQALELKDEEIKDNFIQLPSGEFEYQGNPKQFQNYTKNKILKIFSTDASILQEKINSYQKRKQENYNNIEYQGTSFDTWFNQISFNEYQDMLDKPDRRISRYSSKSMEGVYESSYGQTGELIFSQLSSKQIIEKAKGMLEKLKNYYGLRYENKDLEDWIEKHNGQSATVSDEDFNQLMAILDQVKNSYLVDNQSQSQLDKIISSIAFQSESGESFYDIKANPQTIVTKLGLNKEKLSEMLSLLELTPEGVKRKAELGKWKEDFSNENYAAITDFLDMYFGISKSDFGEAAAEKEENAKKDLISISKGYYDTIFKTDSDLTDTNIYKLLNVLRQSVGFSEELSTSLKSNQVALKDLSKVALRFDNGVQDIAKNIGTWKDEIQSGSLLSITQMRDAYADVLNVQEDVLTTNFLMNKNNLQLLEDAIVNQNKESYIQLRKNLEESIGLGNIKPWISKEIEAIKSQVADANKKIGEEIKTDSINEILQALFKQGKTIQQVAALFENWGINIHLVPIIDDKNDIIGFEQQVGTKITKAANFDWLSKMLSGSALSTIDSASKRINKETQLTKLLDKKVDIYHDINIELNLIDKRLSRLQKIQKNLSGAELLNNLQEQTKVLAEQNKKLKEKQQLQRQDLINQSSILRGLGATFNADGSIANYSSLYGSAINSVNDVIRQIREKETSSYGMDTSSSEYKQIEDEIKELKQEQNKRQEHLDNVEKYINKYDSARNSLFDLVDKIEDSARAAIELNLQIFQAKVQIKLDLTQAQRDWEHFVSETLNRDDILNPNSFGSRQRTVELAFKDIKYFDEDYKNLSDQLKRYQEEIEKFQQARLNGTTYQSELFNSQSEALAAAEQTGKKIQEAVTSYADSIDTIKQAILDAYEDVSEIFSKNNDIYTFIKNQLNHDIQLVDLLEGGRGGRLKDSLYAQISQADIENIKQLRAQADYWANEQAKATDEATRKLARQKWQETIESINSATEEGVQTLKSKYENLIDTVSQEMEDKLTNGFGFDYFSTEWDRVKERTNSYLDPVNAAFAIRNTEFNYQKAINDADGLLTQQKLRKVMEQQLNILKQKDKLTQYDVDRANKILEVEKARMALEEARNNKTTLRLKRDSQGNYSYQFTADAEAIEEAQNKLDKAKNDLYNLDLKAYQNNADKVIKLTQDTQKKIQEIMKDQNLTEEQRKQALLELQKWYQEQLTFLTQENTSIRNNLMQSATDAMSNSFNQGKIDFENMIGGWNSNTQKWINELVKNPDSAFEIMKQGIQEMEQASKQFKDKSNEYLDQAKDAYKAFKENGVDPLVKSEKEAVDNVESLIKKINKITETAQTWRTGLGTVANGFDTIKTSAENAGEAILRFKAALAGSGQKNNKGNDTGGAQYGNNVSGSSTNLPSNFGKAIHMNLSDLIGVEGETEPKKKTIGDSINLDKIPGYTTKHSIQGSGIINSLKSILLDTGKYSGEDIEKSQDGFLLQTHKALEGLGLERETDGKYKEKAFYDAFPDVNEEEIKEYIEIYNKVWVKTKERMRSLSSFSSYMEKYGIKLPPSQIMMKKYGMKFDTGGYTGSWNSSQGKLAFLHEKELILNKDDTQNMLKMLKITRDNQAQTLDYSSIFSTITNNLMAIVKEITLTKMQNDFNHIVESQSDMLKYKSQTGTTAQEIEQQVKIEANFPNVNSKEEIEAALSDLVNMAAQRALKINKN